MVQVTDIPMYASGRKTMLSQASACGTWEQTHTFADGTTRRTMASHTVPGPNGAQAFDVASSAACQDFTAAAAPFRKTVDNTVRLFASRLSGLLEVETPLLTTESGFPFTHFSDVVDNGEHLEHIHAYSKPPTGKEAADKTVAAEGSTLAMHTDQGIFIAFTPALVLADGVAPTDAATDANDASTFFVALPNGERAKAVFDDDALVFMLGDGVEQVVSPKLLHGRTPEANARRFVPRATPYALTVATPPSSAAGASTKRMWYGRMVLPPADAAVAGKATTYGAVRTAMNERIANGGADASIDASTTPIVSLGCASEATSADAPLHALNKRILFDPASCTDASTMACWHRCMPLADGDQLGTSADTCAAQGLLTQCVDSRDQLADPTRHGDFYPACTNTTQPWTPLPSLAASPRAESCDSEAAFIAHADAEAEDAGFATAGLNLTAMCGGSGWGPTATPGSPCLRGKLYWKVRAGVLHAKMIANGIFGWLAVGLSNPGGAHKGMNGGRIVMALPGSPINYSPATGLDLTSGSTVNEYIINEFGGSAFRFWKAPYATPSVTSSAFMSSDCYTSMAFSTTAISGWNLNLTGSDTLIWGLNVADAFVGYHGSENRGIIEVDWTAPPPAADIVAEVDASQMVTPEATAGIAIGTAVAGLALGVLFTSLACMAKKTKAASGGRTSTDGEIAVEVK